MVEVVNSDVEIIGIVIVAVNIILILGAIVLLVNAKRLRKKQMTENEIAKTHNELNNQTQDKGEL